MARTARRTRKRKGFLLIKRAAVALLLLVASNAFAATFTVTSPLDGGPGSLAQAILDANANPGADQIVFAVSPVQVTVSLPAITGVTGIDGTLPGGGKATIQGNLLDCSVAFEFASGSSGSSLTAVIVDNFCDALRIDAGVANVSVTNSALNGEARITGDDNIFRDNSLSLVTITGDRNHLLRNSISLHLRLLFADNTQVGSATEGNTIKSMSMQSSAGTIVEGNIMDRGVSPLAFEAISVSNALPPASSGSTIRGNTISGYTAGVIVHSANSTGITITGNSISNVGIPIDLGGDGPTPNDPAPDPDPGANNLQNFPVLTSAVLGPTQYTVNGTLTSAPLTTYRVELFSGPAADPEARTFLGGLDVVTDATGNATFVFSGTTRPAAGDVITSTATNLTTGDTSEVSAAVAVQAVGLVPTLSPFALLALALSLCVVAAHFIVRI
jgi:hypothetical protein